MWCLGTSLRTRSPDEVLVGPGPCTGRPERACGAERVRGRPCACRAPLLRKMGEHWRADGSLRRSSGTHLSPRQEERSGPTKKKRGVLLPVDGAQLCSVRPCPFAVSPREDLLRTPALLAVCRTVWRMQAPIFFSSQKRGRVDVGNGSLRLLCAQKYSTQVPAYLFF